MKSPRTLSRSHGSEHFFNFVEDLTQWQIYPESDGPDFWFENKIYRILSSTALLRNPEYAERAHVLDRKILTEQRRLNKHRNLDTLPEGRSSPNAFVK